ncbi:hypothetical protein GO308_12875 [Sphingomonas sp. SFZ2018-12]|nr:hypothetical protein [Sphingomonas sp. SFZ2018-12]
MAALNWSADQFWRSTPHEFHAAWEAWRDINCSEKDR